MNNPTAVLELLDWSASIGGEHITASLKGYRDGKYHDEELQHTLTQAEAARLNLKDRASGARYRKGERTQRFETREAAIAEARRVWKQVFPEAKALLVGSFARADAQECLEGPYWFKRGCNGKWRRFEKIGGYEGNEAEAERLYCRYQKLYKRLCETT